MRDAPNLRKCAKCGEEFAANRKAIYCAKHTRKSKRIVPTPEQAEQYKANKNAARNIVRKAKTRARNGEEPAKPAAVFDEDLDKQVIANKILAMVARSIDLYNERMHSMAARDLPTAASQLAKVYEIITGGQASKHNFTTVTIAMVPPAGTTAEQNNGDH